VADCAWRFVPGVTEHDEVWQYENRFFRRDL
jgi:hypothetical protein